LAQPGEASLAPTIIYPMTNTLHLTNGTSTLLSLQQSGVPGDMFSADDILMEGPTPNGLRDDADWELRAEYLEYHFEIPAREYLQEFGERLSRLQQSEHYDEIVLWFEEDLFCQVNLMYLLDWFARYKPKKQLLTLVCPAVERLGALYPSQLAQLFEGREAVSPEKFQLARAAWKAYCALEPTAIETLLAGDFSAWPLLKVGLQNHLRRFPSVRNGLNVVEQELLALLDESSLEFGQLFKRFNSGQVAYQFGTGDSQVAAYLEEMCEGEEPLLTVESIDDTDEEKSNIAITPAGREVAAGRRDWLAMNPVDRWLGGVELTPEKIWRWDEDQGRVISN